MKKEINKPLFFGIMVVIGNIFILTIGFIYGDKIQNSINSVMILVNGIIASLQVFYVQKYKVFSDKFNVDYEKAMKELEIKNNKIKENKDFIYKFIYENLEIKELPLIVSELYKRGFDESLINECLSDLVANGILKIPEEVERKQEENKEVVNNEEVSNQSKKPKNANARTT